MSKLRVAVVFGGCSGEHEVSLVSAQSVMDAMNREQYEVVPLGITKEGRWIMAGDPIARLRAGVSVEDVPPAALLPDPTRRAVLEMESSAGEPERVLREQRIDVVFPVLHGPLGEDGTIQGLLELADLPYVGAGVLASAVGMDKAVAKDVFRGRGLPVVRDLVYLRRDWRAAPDDVIDQIEAALGYDCFVKPACLGSSVGISKAHNRAELRQAMELAASYDRKIVVEEAIDAREIEIAVLGNDQPVASVAGEVVPSREFYDYTAKYVDDRSELLIPAPLTRELAEGMRQIALAAYTALDCAGLSRVDFLLERHSDRYYLSEVNTLPGFTPISMYPKLWEASGVSYSELIDRLIDLAFERHEDKARSCRTYRPAES